MTNQIDELMALADAYALQTKFDFENALNSKPTLAAASHRTVLRQSLEDALKPGEPIGYRYKYLNFMGDEVWAFDPPRNGKVLETVPVYTAASPAQTPAKDMRSQFESWAKSYSTLSIDRDLGGAYVDMNQEMLWHAFQAGVKA